jgi:flagellar basal body rod protein FlgB
MNHPNIINVTAPNFAAAQLEFQTKVQQTPAARYESKDTHIPKESLALSSSAWK